MDVTQRTHISHSRFSVAGAFAAAVLLGLLVVASLSAANAAAATCENEAIREAQTSAALPLGTTYLPSCMALEMVSPPKKAGQEASEVIAFSADETRVLFNSKAPLGETEGLQAFVGDNYVGTRGAAGWVVSPTSPPRDARIVVGSQGGGPFAFSPDLDRWILFGGTQAQKLAGEAQIFSGGLDGGFAPLSPLLAPIDNSGDEKIIFLDANFIANGTSADLSATVFKAFLATTAYLPGDPHAPDPGSPNDQAQNNSYLAYFDENGSPSLALLSRDRDGIVYGGRCGSSVGGGAALNQGAISADGSRIFFSTRPAQEWDQGTHEGPKCDLASPVRIFERTETPTGPAISELLPGEPAAPGNDVFQGASLDGTKVYFTSPRQLSPTDQDPSTEECSAAVGASVGCDLYLYDSSKPPAERVTQVSAGGAGDPTPGKGANVLSSITAISPDGSHAYFVAQGALTTTANPAGKTAVAGKPNLYVYQRDSGHPAGLTSFIATLAGVDRFVGAAGLWGSEQSFAGGGAYTVPMEGAGGAGGDGHVLAFVTKAALVADDQDGEHADAYRYDGEGGTLLCLSCLPGGPDSAPFDVEAGRNEQASTSDFADQGRWVSEDGETVAFATKEPLSTEDEDNAVNPYLWKSGQLARLPGEVGKASQRPVVSRSGDLAGFTSALPLLPQDGDTARDAYLVRVDGGFPFVAAATPCDPLTEGACRGPLPSVPASPTPATGSFVGPGDVTEAKCGKGKVRKGGKCVKKQQKKKGKGKKGKRAHRAGRNGGSK